jgi:hypothetical protein
MNVRVEMDQAFQFWFTKGPMFEGEDWKPTMCINDALYEELQTASKAYLAALSKVEQLYRVQEGMPPWVEPEVPQHKIVAKT